MLSVRCWSAMTTRRFSPDPLADDEGSAMPERAYQMGLRGHLVAGASPLLGAPRNWIEPERDAAGEAVLPLRRQGVELGAVQVSHEPLEPDAAEQPCPADGLQRLLDREPQGLGGDRLADEHRARGRV